MTWSSLRRSLLYQRAPTKKPHFLFPALVGGPCVGGSRCPGGDHRAWPVFTPVLSFPPLQGPCLDLPLFGGRPAWWPKAVSLGSAKTPRLAGASEEARNVYLDKERAGDPFRSPEVWLSHFHVPKPAELSLVLSKTPTIRILGGDWQLLWESSP